MPSQDTLFFFHGRHKTSIYRAKVVAGLDLQSRASNPHNKRDAIELEETLRSLEDAEITSARQVAALASGEDEHPEFELAELRAKHQVCKSLRPRNLWTDMYKKHSVATHHPPVVVFCRKI